MSWTRGTRKIRRSDSGLLGPWRARKIIQKVLSFGYLIKTEIRAWIIRKSILKGTHVAGSKLEGENRGTRLGY